MANPAVDIRRWTREEYEQLAESGFFPPDERLELVDGVIYEMSPQSSSHAATIAGLQAALQPALGPERHLRVQLPLALGSDALPEPDLAIVPGSWRDYLKSHPTTALLVVEVSETSMTHDRERKRKVYARADIPEYWIFYVGAKQIELCRDPRGEDYRSRVILKAGDTLSPLCCPGLSLRVEDLLPP